MRLDLMHHLYGRFAQEVTLSCAHHKRVVSIRQPAHAKAHFETRRYLMGGSLHQSPICAMEVQQGSS
jgi:hypothetical protein